METVNQESFSLLQIKKYYYYFVEIFIEKIKNESFKKNKKIFNIHDFFTGIFKMTENYDNIDNFTLIKVRIISENQNLSFVNETIHRGQSRILRPIFIFLWNSKKVQNKEDILLMLQMLDLKDNNDLHSAKIHLSSWQRDKT